MPASGDSDTRPVVKPAVHFGGTVGIAVMVGCLCFPDSQSHLLGVGAAVTLGLGWVITYFTQIPLCQRN